MVDYHITSQSPLLGEIPLPGDKSISHRAIFLASLSENPSQITGLSAGLDVHYSMQCMQQLGVPIQGSVNDQLTIQGVGLFGLQKPQHTLECGNSGTTMRLLLGILAGCDFTAHLSGDPSLSRRPMQRVAAPLIAMGAQITMQDGHAPITIEGNPALTALTYAMPVASAQVKSALIFAAFFAQGLTIIDEPIATRDHTERLLQYFGYPLTQVGNRISIIGRTPLHAQDLVIPQDISAAAFFIVAASICHGSNILIRHVGMNPGRIGFLQVLQQMGADITIMYPRHVYGEPVADLVVKSAKLRGVTIDAKWVASTIDEFPILMIAAAAAEGQTVIQGAAELRVKESDRLAAMVAGLRQVGIQVTEFPEGAAIEGGAILGGIVDAQGDHRIAMAFCMAGAISQSPILVTNCDNIATSFPNFYHVARQSGLGILEQPC